MPRPRRRIVGGMIYHCLNRGNGRQDLFHTPGDYVEEGKGVTTH